MDKVKLYIDPSCEMAMVVGTDGKTIMMGNYWDFHPGCMGIKEYGDFRSATGLATIVALKQTGAVEYETIVSPWDSWV